jgi:hypothetical protein
VIMTSTVLEAFLLGARIAKPTFDVDEQIVTVGNEPNQPNPDGHAWKLTNSEWREMLQGVRGVCMFLSTVWGSSRSHPVPSAEALSTLRPRGHGVRFFFAAEGANAEEMSADTLEFCVRHMWEYGFLDGDSIADAGSHSDAELWSDVIIPAIERGEIEVEVWGEPL